MGNVRSENAVIHVLVDNNGHCYVFNGIRTATHVS
jgi:hypothetical protein